MNLRFMALWRSIPAAILTDLRSAMDGEPIRLGSFIASMVDYILTFAGPNVVEKALNALLFWYGLQAQSCLRQKMKL
jgi:hypothetical protein